MDNSFTCNVDDVSISASGLRTQSVLRMLQLKGRTLIPVVQGGMGVGISAGGLAGAVARAGGLGTISSVDLRRLHSDLMQRTGHLDKEADARDIIEAANLEALDREIVRAKKLAQGHGMVAVNIMKALSQYQGYVQQALLDDAPDLTQLQVYACGSSAMVRSAQQRLLAAGLPANQFHADAFVCTAAA
jgi:nitronate monooxygenase